MQDPDLTTHMDGMVTIVMVTVTETLIGVMIAVGDSIKTGVRMGKVVFLTTDVHIVVVGDMVTSTAGRD